MIIDSQEVIKDRIEVLRVYHPGSPVVLFPVTVSQSLSQEGDVDCGVQCVCVLGARTFNLSCRWTHALLKTAVV